MSKKIRVAILFGGKSAEHEVSLQSAKNIIHAIDRNKYEVFLIGIDHDGKWYLNDASHFLLHAENPKLISLAKSSENLALIPGEETGQMLSVAKSASIGKIDVVFPVLHGPFGEDGTVQGLLKLADIPFVGAGVLGSAVGMDKDVMKRLLRDAGIPQAKFMTFRNRKNIVYSKIEKMLGIPCFVKPANLGSSVGITKAHDESEFKHAVEKAFRYDNKILIEEYIAGREIECSVLGNENPIASVAGEIIAQHEFYDYNAKYIDEHGAVFEIPARLDQPIVKEIQELAIRSFKILCCEGMARVDFFLKDDNIYVNELNTIPGFTRISMYPKLWQASGISYGDLIDQLIQLALERHEGEKKIRFRITNAL
jgi:D-alanine-D-alanine ligase